MQNDSYLAPDALFLQSQNALEVIELENGKYETLKSDFQSNVVNYTGTGEVATSLKNYAEDFCLVLDKAIEANELDKADHETVENAVETIYADKVDIHENLNGAVILKNIETAQSKIQEIEDRISEIESMSLWDSMWHSVFGSDSVSDLQSQKEGWEKTLEDFQNKEYRYDGIESSTAGLFNDSEGVRELVWAGLEAMENSFIDGEYSPEANVDYASSIYQLRYADFYSACRENVDSNGQALYSDEDIYWYIKYLESQEGFNKDNIQGYSDKIAREPIEYYKLCTFSESSAYYSNYAKLIYANGKYYYVEKQPENTYWGQYAPFAPNPDAKTVRQAGCFIYATSSFLSDIKGEPYTVEQIFKDDGATVTDKGYFNVEYVDKTEKNILSLDGNVEHMSVILDNANVEYSEVNRIGYKPEFSDVCNEIMAGNAYLLHYKYGNVGEHWVYLASVNPDGTINAIGANNSENRFEVISSFDYLQNENVRYDYMIEIKF